MSKPRGARRVFRVPLLLALVSGGGLIGALLREGVADTAWTVAVAVPLVVIGWSIARRPK